MDPLSVAASIAGLYQVVDLAVGRLQIYVKEVRGAKKDIQTLTTSMADLAEILRKLGDLAAQIDTEGNEDTWSRALSIQHNHINACHRTIQNMQSILERSDPSKASSSRDGLIRTLRWPFQLAETRSLIADIEKHKASLTLELLAHNTSGIQGLLQNQSKTRTRMDELKAQYQERLENEERRARREENLQILGFLGENDQETVQSNINSTRYPDTCTWFTDGHEFHEWFEGKNRRLWLCGIPGAGKTVLMSWIVRHIQLRSRQTQSKNGLAFFYCSYQRDETHHVHRILSSIIRQLAEQNQESMVDLKRFYKAHYPEGRSSLTPSTEDLRQLLLCMSEHFEHARIVIDALDEISELRRSDVIEMLRSLASPRTPNVKIMLTSREDSDIRQRLTASDEYRVVEIEAKSSDVRLYVEYELNKANIHW
ncbi:hypothetical protein MMC30_004121 [Trapelia coarctata]|nr:hypothetical protein [Trapelia coarctata]